MKLQKYLRSLGYKTYRCTKKGYIPTQNEEVFSTMTEGGLSVDYVKDFSVFTIGLDTLHRPPTLIYPKLKMLDSENYEDLCNKMERFIANNNPEEIFNELYEYSLVDDVTKYEQFKD